MTNWSELTPREKLVGLRNAVKRQVSPGVYRYAFVHDDMEIDNPSMDATGRYFVSPREYGFAIRGFPEGKTAWARDFDNGSMLVVNADGLSHVLSPKVPARILFVATNGTLLQDTGNVLRMPQHTPELVTVRLIVNATFDLHGESPESARVLLMRMVDRALLSGPLSGESDATVIEHTFELGAVIANETSSSGDTDFSQLLDI